MWVRAGPHRASRTDTLTHASVLVGPETIDAQTVPVLPDAVWVCGRNDAVLSVVAYGADGTRPAGGYLLELSLRAISQGFRYKHLSVVPFPRFLRAAPVMSPRARGPPPGSPRGAGARAAPGPRRPDERSRDVETKRGSRERGTSVSATPERSDLAPRPASRRHSESTAVRGTGTAERSCATIYRYTSHASTASLQWTSGVNNHEGATLELRPQRCAHCGNVSPRPPRGRGPTRERAAWELRGRCHLPDAQTAWFSTLLWSPASLHTEFSDALVLGALRPHRCGLGPLGRPTRCPRWPSVGGACKLAGAWLRSPRGHPR